ncbi:hypothetical protein ACFL0Q_00550 [Thermodesulfobacteriota bacterium]
MKPEVEIEIDINGYCIETGSKWAYERLLVRYFDKSISALDRLILEEQIEGITFFLKHADLKRLRSQYPELDGTRTMRLILKIPKNKHEMTIEYKGVEIAPISKTHSSL